MSKNNVCPVPQSQRPINEYKTLKNSLNFAWTINESEYFFKDVGVLILFLVCFSFFHFQFFTLYIIHKLIIQPRN